MPIKKKNALLSLVDLAKLSYTDLDTNTTRIFSTAHSDMAVAVEPLTDDQSMIVTCGIDGKLIVHSWSSQALKQRTELQEEDWIRCARRSGERLYIGLIDGTIVSRDVHSMRLSSRASISHMPSIGVSTGPSAIRQLHGDTADPSLVVTNRAGYFSLYDPRADTWGEALRAHRHALNTLDVSPHGEILSSGRDSTVKLWDARHLTRPLTVFSNHRCQRSMLAASFSAQGHIIAGDERGGAVVYHNNGSFNSHPHRDHILPDAEQGAHVLTAVGTKLVAVTGDRSRQLVVCDLGPRKEAHHLIGGITPQWAASHAISTMAATTIGTNPSTPTNAPSPAFNTPSIRPTRPPVHQRTRSAPPTGLDLLTAEYRELSSAYLSKFSDIILAGFRTYNLSATSTFSALKAVSHLFDGTTLPGRGLIILWRLQQDYMSRMKILSQTLGESDGLGDVEVGRAAEWLMIRHSARVERMRQRWALDVD
ncbi:WD domain, G-beta repeat [Carpediemonas membranifera]|uniref:WD domain, G-beta repeat n=1 Tax=Carpediemonas membranifera TaxID=201153 RepID=A0A8J6E094_9EUKA|nr:WD domain, G-beta repeat [Carpediemonas membranifera]|eukprot:KAG9391868.1 WD domain, G-beta repeat [Carpediemonas membranifera]